MAGQNVRLMQKRPAARLSTRFRCQAGLKAQPTAWNGDERSMQPPSIVIAEGDCRGGRSRCEVSLGDRAGMAARYGAAQSVSASMQSVPCWLHGRRMLCWRRKVDARHCRDQHKHTHTHIFVPTRKILRIFSPRSCRDPLSLCMMVDNQMWLGARRFLLLDSPPFLSVDPLLT